MKKFKNKKGFTLAELLIVVAIVAVLVAISIPIFSGKLNKAKDATNKANVRAAKAAAVADFLSDGKTETMTYTYDVKQGKIINAEQKDGSSLKATASKDNILETVIVITKVGTDGTTSVQTKPDIDSISGGTLKNNADVTVK